jgi:ketosteroid isomerase-like protein
MTEEQMKNTMRDLVKALTAKDVEKMLSFLAEDASWTAPEGTFKGKAELKRYATWLIQTIPDLSAVDTGIKTMAQGNIGVYEHAFSGTFKGRKWQSPSMCIYEFSGDKILNIRTVYDRLSMAKQAAAGVVDRWVVGSLVGSMEKGLR